MPQTVNINGVAISYPIIGDTEWGVEATKFAELVGVVLQKIGQGNQSTTNNIVIGSISSPGNLTVASGDLSVSGNTTLTGNLTANGNTTLGNANTDTIAVTGILNVDSGTLYVNPTDNRVGINDSSPSEALDVIGNALVSGSVTAASATLTNLTVDTNLIKTDSTNDRVGINTTSPTVALDVTGAGLFSSDLTVGGIIVADDSTNVTTAPPIAFTGDLNTGIGHSAADTLDFVTGGQSRFRIEPTGQIKAVYESQVGTDYNTQLDNGYLCRAWVNFDGTGTFSPNPSTTTIRASGNVSSITDNGTGDYTVNFANAMPDANYSTLTSGKQVNSNAISSNGTLLMYYDQSTGSVKITSSNIQAGASTDSVLISVGIFR